MDPTNKEPKAGEPKEPQQSEVVSKKDFDDLKSMFEQVQKAQQGSDKKVKELLDQLKAKDDEIAAEKEKAKTANMDKVDQLSEQIKSMSDKIEATSRDAAKKEFLANGYKLATDLKVHTSLVDNYGGNPDGLEEFLKNVKAENDAAIEAAVNEKMAGGYKPTGSNGAATSDNWDSKKHTTQENKDYWRKFYTEQGKEQPA